MHLMSVLAVIKNGDASFIGFGRNSFAYPEMPEDLMKEGRADPDKDLHYLLGMHKADPEPETRGVRNPRQGDLW